MYLQTIINRTEAWEEKISQIRQTLVDFERDMESFKNFCKKEQELADGAEATTNNRLY